VKTQIVALDSHFSIKLGACFAELTTFDPTVNLRRESLVDLDVADTNKVLISCVTYTDDLRASEQCLDPHAGQIGQRDALHLFSEYLSN